MDFISLFADSPENWAPGQVECCQLRQYAALKEIGSLNYQISHFKGNLMQR